MAVQTNSKSNKSALNVISKTLDIKSEIDRKININEVKRSSDVEILPETQDNSLNLKGEDIHSLIYEIKHVSFGLNVISNLNLGRAYQLVNPEEDQEHIEKFEYNISPKAKRYAYSESENNKMNRKWIDYVIEKVKNGRSSVVILENIFDRVTTGNYEIMLPYKEQLKYAYNLFNDDKFKDKIVAFVRGRKEMSIIENGGPDLMYLLAKMMRQENKVIGTDAYISIVLKDKSFGSQTVTLKPVEGNSSASQNFYGVMQNFARDNCAGFDVYFNTSSKRTAYFNGVTTENTNGELVEKPCHFICFGPMSEYDYFNAKRPQLGPYELNRMWHKVAVDENGSIKLFWQDYTFPHNEKRDKSNYTSSVVSNIASEVLANYSDEVLNAIDNSIEKTSNEIRANVYNTLQEMKKEQKKKRTNRKSIKQISQDILEEVDEEDEYGL